MAPILKKKIAKFPNFQVKGDLPHSPHVQVQMEICQILQNSKSKGICINFPMFKFMGIFRIALFSKKAFGEFPELQVKENVQNCPNFQKIGFTKWAQI